MLESFPIVYSDITRTLTVVFNEIKTDPALEEIKNSNGEVTLIAEPSSKLRDHHSVIFCDSNERKKISSEQYNSEVAAGIKRIFIDNFDDPQD